jgi:outer membrane protein
LPATIAGALAHAPAEAEAQAGEAAAKARLDGARAESNPLVGVDGSWGTGRIDNGGFFGFTAAHTYPLSLRASGELPLYAGGRTAAAIAGAQGGVAIARDQAEQSHLAVIVEAVATYADVLSARRLTARTHQLLGELTEVVRQAELRFKTGEIPTSDLAAAKARLAEGEAGLAQAEGRLTSAEAHYQRLTGHAAGDLATLPLPPVIPASLDEATDRAHAANPMLKQASDAILTARAGVRGAKAESLPTIGAFTEATRMRDEFFPGYRADAVTVGVRGHWTLWAGGRTAAKIHEADANLDASEARARETRQAVDGAVIDAWSAFHTAQRMVEATNARVAATQEALRSTKLEAKVGAKPTLAVLDAEREAMAAEAAEIDAEGQRLVAAWQINALTDTATP